MREGQVVLRVKTHLREADEELIVVFPDFYPELRFEVYAPALTLPRHQNPFEKNLCLLDRSTRAWRTTDSAAEFVVERVPRLLDLLEDEQALREAEVPQGEPVTAYYEYKAGSTFLLPEFALGLPADGGRMQLLARPAGDGLGLRCIVSRLYDNANGLAGDLDESWRRAFGGEVVAGRWVRLTEPAAAKDAEGVYRTLLESGSISPFKQRRLQVLGVTFPEEVRQGVYEDGWLLLVQEASGERYLAKSQRVGEEDFAVRIPRLSFLRNKTVGIAGLGGLGAPSALEFARAQVGELRILDWDSVEAGTIVRWPLGVQAVGYGKAHVLCDFIARNYPRTQLKCFQARIGRAHAGSTGERELISQFLDGLDIVYDATAEYGIQHLLSNLARGWGIPQVYVSGTEGGWGGVVARCIPQVTGCWLCWKHAVDDGTIPVPNLEPSGEIQPRGCADRTFAGAGFDLLPVVAQGVRLAVQTLAEASDFEQSYGEAGTDVSVLNLRNDNGQSAGCPQWQHFRLEKHPKCEYCSLS